MGKGLLSEMFWVLLESYGVANELCFIWFGKDLTWLVFIIILGFFLLDLDGLGIITGNFDTLFALLAVCLVTPPYFCWALFILELLGILALFYSIELELDEWLLLDSSMTSWICASFLNCNFLGSILTSLIDLLWWKPPIIRVLGWCEGVLFEFSLNTLLGCAFCLLIILKLFFWPCREYLCMTWLSSSSGA